MEHSESTIVDRPASVVWGLTGHPSGWQSWVDDIKDVQVEGDGPLALGSVVRYRWRGRDVTAEVVQFVEGRVFGIHSSEGWYEFRESIALRDLGEQTDVTFTMGFEPTTWWGRILAVVLTPVRPLILGRPLKKELQSLKEAVERQAISHG